MEEEDCRREIVRKRELYKIKIKLEDRMDKERRGGWKEEYGGER